MVIQTVFFLFLKKNQEKMRGHTSYNVAYVQPTSKEQKQETVYRMWEAK